MSQRNLERLYQKIGYCFKKPALVKQALTHCSAGDKNNERLEFLGDAILNFIIAQILYTQGTQHNEGQMSRLRASLVKGETLAEIAMDLDLGAFLYLGPGELRSGGHRRASIVADALEALIAAIYLDGGVEAAHQFILHLYKKRLDTADLDQLFKDAKTELQELLQARKMPLPTYHLLQTTVDEQEPLFHVRCSIQGLAEVTEARAANRRKAEQEAARLMLLFLK